MTGAAESRLSTIAGARPPRAPAAQPPPQRWWTWTKRGLTLLFFVLIAALLFRQARDIDWQDVLAAMRNSSPTVLVAATAVAAASHLLYSSFDLFGRHLTKHWLPRLRVMGITFVSYIFNLNFGSLVGGLALRYRLYSRHGLAAGTTTTIVATSMVTNWLGYLLVAGAVLMFSPPALPPEWTLADGPLRLIGALMTGVALAWLVACRFAKRRVWQVRGHAITLPRAPLALLQLVASSTNWMLMATVIWLLLGQRIDYPLVLGTLLVGAVAGVLTHVPAGLGVLEAVFIALLGSDMPHGELLGAVLLYRAIYYLGPLPAATGLLWYLEASSGNAQGGRPHRSTASAEATGHPASAP